MDILFLGTSSATPTKARNVSGAAVIDTVGSGWTLVDCGEGTQHRLLHTALSLNDLRAVCISHVHGDHCYGLPGLLATAGLLGRKHPLTIVAPAGIEEWIAATLRCSRLELPYALAFAAVEAGGPWEWGRMTVDAVALSHRVPSFAYRFCEPQDEPALDTAKLLEHGIPRGPLWGRLQQGETVEFGGVRYDPADFLLPPPPPLSAIVAGDNDRPELLRTACEGVDVLVHEATYTEEVAVRTARDTGHSTAGAVAAFAASVNLPNLVLTHFSARYQSGGKSPSVEDIRAEAAAHYGGRLFLAEDLARFRLGKQGRFDRIA
ncbi:MBL fold metallo-hydrolase [Oxalobacteraceae bacterium OM1]|nr:MBL fold metallo-hydrolase [Oxalobacteraceae bacterium OM1]